MKSTTPAARAAAADHGPVGSERGATRPGPQRSRRGAPDMNFYERIGRTNYQLVSSHATARRCELNDVYRELADRFREVRLALNQLSDQLLNLDEDLTASLFL